MSSNPTPPHQHPPNFRRHTQRFRNRAIRGFSFIEIMIVVVIIGLLAGAVALNVGSYVDKAKINRAKSDIATIISAIETYYGEHGRYPTNEEGLEALDLKNPKDPWGRDYQYNIPGREKDSPYEIICFGADGREGGVKSNADIGSWSLDQTPGSSPPVPGSAAHGQNTAGSTP